MSGISKQSLISWGKTLLLVGLVAFVGRSVISSSSGPSTGTQAAEFSLASADGAGPMTLAALRGTPVLIEAMSSWCSACRSVAGTVNAAARTPRERPVRFVSILLDSTPAAAQALRASWGIEHDLLLDDGSFTRDYSISMLPTFILIDAAGVVRKVYSGRPDQDDIEDWLSSVNDAAAL